MQKKLFEAMPLAMLPTKSRQHCQDQMIWANIFDYQMVAERSEFIQPSKFFKKSVASN